MHEIDILKLSDQTKYRLYKIKKFDNYFINEINKRESYSKNLTKYVTIFDYIDKILIVLSATSSSVSYFICKYYWCACWNSRCILYFNFFYNSRSH